MQTRLPSLALAAAVALPGPGGAAPAGGPPVEIVVCAPGYPGSTGEAQPTMDQFAVSAATAAGWPEGSLAAVYFETEEGGLARLDRAGAGLAVVPYSFYWAHGERLALRPLLEVARPHGTTEVWTLVAHKDRVRGAADLDGWEVTGLPGHAPGFVRARLLQAFGPLPETTRITFAPGVLSALRRAAAGEDVAVLLDPPQEDGLSALPFARDLAVVTRSPAVPGFVLCAVGDRVDDERLAALESALVKLHRSREGRDVLEAMRIVRFAGLERGRWPGSAPAGRAGAR